MDKIIDMSLRGPIFEDFFVHLERWLKEPKKAIYSSATAIISESLFAFGTLKLCFYRVYTVAQSLDFVITLCLELLTFVLKHSRGSIT